MEEFLQKVWKDAQAGRVLLASADHAALDKTPDCPGVITAPAGRAPKYAPDRTVLPEGRFINDARRYNLGCHKRRHPPALTPRHRELARTILLWSVRFPGIPVYLSKRDVAAAFKLIYVSPDDVGGMATELDGPALRKAYEGSLTTLLRGCQKVANLVALYLVLVFGFLGSPGEWVVWSWALAQAFNSHAPQDAVWHDLSLFFCHFLVDDQVLVEPDLGRRR